MQLQAGAGVRVPICAHHLPKLWPNRLDAEYGPRRAPRSRKNTLMAEWWDGKPDERYWCEITGRDDIGANLRCPQTSDLGKPYWSYSLINQVKPGDIVFHYSKQKQCVIGALNRPEFRRDSIT
jgi:hypothetical protein